MGGSKLRFKAAGPALFTWATECPAVKVEHCLWDAERVKECRDGGGGGTVQSLVSVPIQGESL